MIRLVVTVQEGALPQIEWTDGGTFNEKGSMYYILEHIMDQIRDFPIERIELFDKRDEDNGEQRY